MLTIWVWAKAAEVIQQWLKIWLNMFWLMLPWDNCQNLDKSAFAPMRRAEVMTLVIETMNQMFLRSSQNLFVPPPPHPHLKIPSDASSVQTRACTAISINKIAGYKQFQLAHEYLPRFDASISMNLSILSNTGQQFWHKGCSHIYLLPRNPELWFRNWNIWPKSNPCLWHQSLIHRDHRNTIWTASHPWLNPG